MVYYEKIKKEYGMTDKEVEECKEKIKRKEMMKKMKKEMEREEAERKRPIKEESKMKEKEYMEEMLEEKEGGKVRLLSVYEKYYEWLREDEEIPKEKKADPQDTTRCMRNYIKEKEYEIVQGKIDKRNSKCIKNMVWKDDPENAKKAEKVEGNASTKMVKEYLEEVVIKTEDKKDRIPIIEIIQNYNEWVFMKDEPEKYKKMNEEGWKRNATAAGYDIKTAKAVIKKQNTETCLPCILGVRMKVLPL